MSRETAMQWDRAMVMAPATAAGAAAAWVADWQTGLSAAAAAFGCAVVVMAMAVRAATERFLDEAESAALSPAEQALARRVGLDSGTVRAAKDSVRAAVRETMARRAAGLVALCAVPRQAADAAWARAQAAAPEYAAESSGSESPAASLSGPAGSRAAAGSAPAPAHRVDAGSARRDDVE